jgi:hypothetical protein
VLARELKENERTAVEPAADSKGDGKRPAQQVLVAAGKPPQHFAFDSVYWSMDGFRRLDNGTLEADSRGSASGRPYASQEVLYSELADSLLNDAIDKSICTARHCPAAPRFAE